MDKMFYNGRLLLVVKQIFHENWRNTVESNEFGSPIFTNRHTNAHSCNVRITNHQTRKFVPLAAQIIVWNANNSVHYPLTFLEERNYDIGRQTWKRVVVSDNRHHTRKSADALPGFQKGMSSLLKHEDVVSVWKYREIDFFYST